MRGGVWASNLNDFTFKAQTGVPAAPSNAGKPCAKIYVAPNGDLCVIFDNGNNQIIKAK